MAQFLADRDIRKLIGTAIIGASTELLNPNGIELRLGGHVLFHSTNEEKRLQPDEYLQVSPGEAVTISSIEEIDFTAATVAKIFPGHMLMGLITPTTTMMREGIAQVSTKIDAGFKGILNWGLRNGSIRDLRLAYGEPIFKLTILLLDEGESPDKAYGSRSDDHYQNTSGIARSSRQMPVDIPENKIIQSDYSLLDPKKQLKQAGYPFDHIGTELAELHGKFEVVSKDVLLMKEEFNTRTTELTTTIETETSALSRKIDETKNIILDKFELLFNRKFLLIAGVVSATAPLLYGAIKYLQDANVPSNTVTLITIITGFIIAGIFFIFRWKDHH